MVKTADLTVALRAEDVLTPRLELSLLRAALTTVRLVDYFRFQQVHDVSLALLNDSVRMSEEAAATFERSGDDIRRYLPKFDMAELTRKRDEGLREYEAVEEERLATLSAIRRRVLKDAEAAWRSGDCYFAPVLFQPLARHGAGWEVALQEITGVGWRLDSWQVIGAAPPPFENTVTLLQTLFVR